MGDVDYLYEPEGSELHWDALKRKQEPLVQQASLSGPSNPFTQRHPADRQGMQGTRPMDAAPAPRQPSLEEQMRALEGYVRGNQATLSNPAAVQERSTEPQWLRDYMAHEDTDI